MELLELDKNVAFASGTDAGGSRGGFDSRPAAKFLLSSRDAIGVVLWMALGKVACGPELEKVGREGVLDVLGGWSLIAEES